MKFMQVPFAILVVASISVLAHAEQKNYESWHTTNGLEKFPCMDDEETKYFSRWISVTKNEEKSEILAEHRKQVKPSRRAPASVKGQNLVSKTYICPPFRGVRNPHPGEVEFGKASTFERIRITDSSMQILSGLKKNESWPLHYESSKGYFEGQTKSGTPINIIPMIPAANEKVRFIMQYLVWQDKTPPTLTLCYREDLHAQCNPYKKPEEKAPAASASSRQPASLQSVKKNAG